MLSPSILMVVMRAPGAIILAIATFLLPSCALAQQSAKQPSVEVQYCSMKAGRPPLKYLSFNVTIRNTADKPQWFLFPASLYDKPVTGRKNAGINAVELLSDSPEHKVTVVDFMGTMKLQPSGAGGFKGVLLPAGAVVSIHGFGISFWGEPASPLPIHVVVADKMVIGGAEVGKWLGKDLLSAKNADVKDLQHAAGSRSTEDSRELPVKITKSSQLDVPDALAKRCEETSR